MMSSLVKSHRKHIKMFKRVAFPISHFAKTTALKFPIASRMGMPVVMQYRNFYQMDDFKATFKCDACTSPCKLKTETSTDEPTEPIKSEPTETLKLETTEQVKPQEQSTSDRYTTPPNPTTRQWMDTSSSWYEPIARPHDTSAYGLYLILAKRYHNGIIRFYRCMDKMIDAMGMITETRSCESDLPFRFQDRIISQAQFETMLDLRNIISTLCTISKFITLTLMNGSLHMAAGALITAFFLGRAFVMSIPLLLFIGICIWFPWVTIPTIAVVLGLCLWH
ncbi:Hypothetical protein MVR_LOCUS399 [uncultured virus]|nr:Hypothetical protein MVR_LOCUS399 [uncultured virus]